MSVETSEVIVAEKTDADPLKDNRPNAEKDLLEGREVEPLKGLDSQEKPKRALADLQKEIRAQLDAKGRHPVMGS